MNQEHLGLRPEDQTPDEAVQAARAPEHARALALGARIATLPQRPGPASLERRRRPATRAGWVAAIAVAAAVLLGLQVAPTVRDRGVTGLAEPAVRLEAVAEGPTGLRPLRAGDAVGPDERVLFRVHASAAGALTLREDDAATVWDGPVQAGAFTPGGDALLSWRPDTGSGPRTYTATLCVADRCDTDGLTLRWLP
jgi:hypothetical protein